MSTKKLLALWSLKWNPFTPELPHDALWVTPKIDSFAWRVEQLVQEGGFALISGGSGTGKSVALRIVAQRLSAMRDVLVGVVERPQSKSGDFYRELGDIFSVQLRPSNRWGGFRALRERWKAHVAATRIKPVLLVDEAQEMDASVLSELRILASAKYLAKVWKSHLALHTISQAHQCNAVQRSRRAIRFRGRKLSRGKPLGTWRVRQDLNLQPSDPKF